MEKLLDDIRKWAEKDDNIESLIIVGSYARGTFNKNSDIDIVIITANKEKMLRKQEFIEKFGDIQKSQIEYYGACTSIRVFYKNGKEIEFGIVETSWIKQPLDSGTHKVLSDGFKVIVDKKEYFKDLVVEKSIKQCNCR